MCQNEPWEQSLRQRNSIPHRKAHHREFTGLPSGSTGNGQKGQGGPPFHRAEGTTTSGAQGGTAKILQLGRNKTKQIPPDQGSNPDYDPLLSLISPGPACIIMSGIGHRCRSVRLSICLSAYLVAYESECIYVC